MNKFLVEILNGREERAFEIRRLNKEYEEIVICLTLNIPGPYKLGENYRFAFEEAVKALELALDTKVLKERSPASGYEAYFISDKNIEEIKEIALKLEETHPLGRLFDIDIFYKDLSKISREDLGISKRKCLLCNKDAVECSRSRTHSVLELTAAIEEMILRFKQRENK